MKQRIGRAQFTLVELMIVVAIIALLAAIAVPQLRQATLKARISEVYVNAKGIEDAQVGYNAAMDDYVYSLPPVWTPNGVPGPFPGKTPVAWQTGSSFDVLGWRPDGAVRCAYSMTGMCSCPAAQVASDACVICDVDADGNGVFWIQCLPGAMVPSQWIFGGGPPVTW